MEQRVQQRRDEHQRHVDGAMPDWLLNGARLLLRLHEVDQPGEEEGAEVGQEGGAQLEEGVEGDLRPEGAHQRPHQPGGGEVDALLCIVAGLRFTALHHEKSTELGGVDDGPVDGLKCPNLREGQRRPTEGVPDDGRHPPEGEAGENGGVIKGALGKTAQIRELSKDGVCLVDLF